MDKEKIFDDLKNIFVNEMGVNEIAIKMNASLCNDLGLDSMDLVSLIMEIEKTFDVRVTAAEEEELAFMRPTVQDVVDKIAEKIEKTATSSQKQTPSKPVDTCSSLSDLLQQIQRNIEEFASASNSKISFTIVKTDGSYKLDVS